MKRRRIRPDLANAALMAAVSEAAVLYEENGQVGFVWYDRRLDRVKVVPLTSLH